MFRIVFCLPIILLGALGLQAECNHVHCRFEYLGSRMGAGYTEDSFLNESSVSELKDKYCVAEYMTSFRKLNWYLYQLELSACKGDVAGVTNAVNCVSLLLQSVKCGDDSVSGISYPNSLKLQWLEKIEYSIARMILSDARNVIAPHLEALLPDSILDDREGGRSMCSIKTFKRMLCLAAAIENYHEYEGCYPVNLDSIAIAEKMRKCAYGRDIEYEYYRGKWVLRCRCESWEGGLKFDEYIPVIYQQRKRLDLCFSSTFNEKRCSLFKGEAMGTNDLRLSGRVFHDVHTMGVHPIQFTDPSAGCVRIVPLTEQADRDEKESFKNKADSN